MDPFTHWLMALLISVALGLHQKYGPFAVATLVAASLAPDLDGLPILWGQKYFYQYHRVLFHSLGSGLLLGLAISIAVYLLTPLKNFWLVLLLSLFGVLIHLGVDTLSSWKIPLLYPISSQRYSMDLVWFIDLPTLLAIAFALLFAHVTPGNARLIAGTSLALIVIYVGFRLYQQRSITNYMQGNLLSQESATVVGVIPHQLGVFNWHAVVQQDDSYAVHDVHFCLAPGGTRVITSQTVSSSAEKEIIASSREADLVGIFLQRARFPVAFVEKHGCEYEVEWNDVHLMLAGGGIRGVKVIVDEKGQIIMQRFKLKPELEVLQPDMFPGEKSQDPPCD